ncbi:hypothetical protein [Saccharopolyspora mangrovi]|uniref:MFS transporter n=1 Tax=Saccharopolyspora mangrovi TaxID=3082379 RepID=A0ABU6A6K8_9PSEU|nr:hypothetical protein [Saccharopolyspora sp. S2-29]MEB3367180.1 hypothetical protein [Saccharopolyspora sp. S2-29]
MGVLATALYYAMWNVGANTMGQFGSFLYVNVGGGEVATYSLVSTIGLGAGLLAGLVFMRFVDTRARRHLFAAGSLVIVLAWVWPLVVGFGEFSLLATLLLSGLGSSFAGETIYKVWSQELFPTLLRGTAQGATIAFGRVVAALIVSPLRRRSHLHRCRGAGGPRRWHRPVLDTEASGCAAARGGRRERMVKGCRGIASPRRNRPVRVLDRQVDGPGPPRPALDRLR